MTEQGETNDAGEFPWGESDSSSDAKAWIKANYIDAEQAKHLKGLAEMLTFKKKELDENQIIEYRTLIDERVEDFKRENIESHLENYVKDKKSKKKFDKSQARNVNFPRSHVKDHLKNILDRHRDLIDRYDEFVEILFCPCNTKDNKNKAIFHFNRKTPQEARLLYEKKVKTCPWCNELELPSEKCGKQNDQEIILWNLLDFVSVRTFDLSFKEKKNTTVKRGKLTEAMVRTPIEGVKKGLKWGELKKSAESAEKGIKFAKGDWNKKQLEQLKDICTPPANRKNKRANISTQAAKALFEKFTENGQTFDPDAVEANKEEWDLYNKRQKIRSEVVFYPQVRTLLGTIFQKGEKKGEFATTGFLQRLFGKELSDQLGGKTVPDYCIIECIKNPAISAEKKAEIEKEQKKNRERAEKLLENFGIDPKKVKNSDRLRVILFDQQGGTKGIPALCPFTGHELGNDPFAPNLELAHIFPDSRGGLYMRDNLVLTTRDVNATMGNQTPYEAAQKNLPDWRSWKEMKELAKSFKWGRSKRDIFFREDSTFPDFNNLTYTAQLARELRNMAAHWMGISEDAEALRQRIGNPHGIYTAAARKSLTGSWYEAKDRQTHTHHRVDAAVLSCLPPTGLNDAQYGGVFRNVKTTKDGKEYRQFECCLQEGNSFLPDLSILKDESHTEPPVIKRRNNSKYQSLGDSTFWSYSFGKPCLQRCPFSLEKKTSDGKTKKLSAFEIWEHLKRMGISDTPNGNRSLLPSEKEIQKWIDSQTQATEDDSTLGLKTAQAKTFRLNSKDGEFQKGTPVKHLVKIDGKGNLNNSPLTWNGKLSKDGKFDQLRSLDSANDRLEIWLGWNPKKKQWEYQKRLVPTKQCLLGIKRMGIPWRGRHNAPDYLIQLLDANKAKNLKTLICGTLLPHSKKVATFRKGDVFWMEFTVTANQETKAKKTVACWMEVSALQSDGRIELKPLTVKEKIKTLKGKLEDLAFLKGLPKSTEQEQLKKLYENPSA